MDLATLLDTYRAPLVGLVASWGASWHDANELAMDSFAEAWLRREQCRGDWRDPAVFAAWMRGIARNLYRNQLRANRRREQRIHPSEAQVQDAASPAPPHEEGHERLHAAIGRLPRRQREVVLMHYLDETRIADVAALLGVTEKAVEGRLYQARKALRRKLGRAPTRSQVERMLLCL